MSTPAMHAARKRPIRRRTVITLIVLALLLIAHPLVLRILAWPLEAGEGPAEFDCFCLHGAEMGIDGDQPFLHAAQWHGTAAGRKILLLIPRASRTVEIGALPSFEQTCRKELAKLGIPAADVEAIPADARNAWDEARALDAWLQQHPRASVALACSPFAGGRLQYAFHKVIGPAEAARLHLLPLSDPGRPAPAWWRSRAGVKEFMYGWLDLLYTWNQGDDVRVAPPGAVEFQREVRATIGEAPR